MSAKVLVIRGLLSVFLSRAMETLTDRINAKFPGTATVTDHGSNWVGPATWLNNVPNLTQQCIDACYAKQKVILIGHSFGGTSVLMVTRNLKKFGIIVDLAAPIDPAGQYDCSISNNVKRGISFYNTMPNQLGHGVVCPDYTWGKDSKEQESEFQKVFSVVQGKFESHLQIATDPVVQNAVYNAVVDVIEGK